MIDLDKVEAWRLREAITELLARIANGSISKEELGGVSIAQMIDSAEKRIAAIERNDEEGREKERQESLRELAIAYKVELETRLNAQEKLQYESFLKKDFFTKSDFGNLETFYTNSYDKLTDGGKAEMSTRVWEGVRRKEYEFIELPDIVKAKEAQRLHEVFSASRKLPSELQRIPEHDRTDFVREWDAGDKQASYKVLNRKSFSENVSLSASPIQSAKAVGETPSHKEDIKQAAPVERTTDTQNTAMGAEDFSLGDLQLVEQSKATHGAPLPGNKQSGLVKGS